MDRDLLLQFIPREWASVAESKARFWQALKRRRPASEVLAIADRMRTYAQGLRPDWPTRAERVEDAQVHRQVGEALRAVRCRPR